MTLTPSPRMIYCEGKSYIRNTHLQLKYSKYGPKGYVTSRNYLYYFTFLYRYLHLHSMIGLSLSHLEYKANGQDYSVHRCQCTTFLNDIKHASCVYKSSIKIMAQELMYFRMLVTNYSMIVGMFTSKGAGVSYNCWNAFRMQQEDLIPYMSQYMTSTWSVCLTRPTQRAISKIYTTSPKHVTLVFGFHQFKVV